MSFAFPSPALSHQIIIGSIYFWSGLSKVINEEFYETVAPIIFVPLDSIPIFFAKLLRVSESTSKRMVRAFYTCGLLAETLKPIILAFPSIFGPTLRLLALSFNLFFHFHISWVMGYPKGRWSWIPWNMWCLISTQIAFSPYWNPSEYVFSIGLSPFHLLLVTVFTLIPISAFFGQCPNYCLAHFFFAPGWIGKAYLFIPREGFAKLPRSQRGGPLPSIAPSDPTDPNPNPQPAFFELERFVKPKAFMNRVKFDGEVTDLIGIGNDWLNEAYNLGRSDPFEEAYGPIRPTFARQILSARGLTWAILLRELDYSILRDANDSRYRAELVFANEP